jgi:hypothetical protein
MKLITDKFQKSNLYKILVSVFIVLWFYAITKIITVLTGNSDDILLNIVLAGLALGFFLMDDGKLNELYNMSLYKDTPVPTITTLTG